MYFCCFADSVDRPPSRECQFLSDNAKVGAAEGVGRSMEAVVEVAAGGVGEEREKMGEEAEEDCPEAVVEFRKRMVEGVVLHMHQAIRVSIFMAKQ